MKKFMLGVTLMLAMVASAFAVDTPFSNNIFSATFNGTVEASVTNNPTNTTYNEQSFDDIAAVQENVDYRIVTHTITPDVSSSNWYLQQEVANVQGNLVNTSTDTYQGRVFTYGYYTFVREGFTLVKRTRILILSDRTVLFVSQIYEASKDANDGGAATRESWSSFANSVVIK